MQLRLKVTLLLVGALALSAAVNHAIQRFAVAPSFRALEHEAALADWERCRSAISREQESLSDLCFDWASWDDAYAYVQGKNAEFFDANLKNEAWFTDQRIDALYFCRPDGTVFYKHLVEGVDTREGGGFPPATALPKDHPLMAVQADKESHVDGLMRTSGGLMMVSARPILTSTNQGPLAGVLIFGRRVGDTMVEALRAQTGVEFSLAVAGDAAMPPEDAAALASGDDPAEELLDEDHLTVRGSLKDLGGSPLVLVRTTAGRGITRQGRAAVRIAGASLAASGCLTLGVLLVSLRRMVVGPVRALTDYAGSVAARGDSGVVPGAGRSDELGTLARSVREMLGQLEQLRAESVALSRDAGKAEVAAGVLHNVGNAVNNVGVLVDAIAERAGSTKAPGVAKVAGLLEKNAGDLPGLFSRGGAGEQLPAYVSKLAEQLAREGEGLSEDLRALREGLAHVRQIVASHEGLAAGPRMEEALDLRIVAEASVLLVGESLRRHGVSLSVEGPAGVMVRGDRSSLTQVLVNLLTNAKEAMAGREGRAITVRVSAGAGVGRLEVADRGPGVAADARERVFLKGYTTKTNGHGIGLHHSWLAVRDMGGALTLLDTGPGATFRVDLPAAVAAGRSA